MLSTRYGSNAKMCKRGVAYAAPYSILIPIISLQHIDMRFPYFPILVQQVCWVGIPISYS
ncbi:hypothetical protein FP362_04315 [Enterobacter hormaechei]|nr:hypothetical protein [Enterobacter hormaechei]MBY5147459.1 hypothetical protein [Enterobacter hormaechei]QFH86338.1 hypothetical protein FR760_16360 [Enterobacter hormaechei]RTN89879.1 hypothetical protein EKN77_03105 [Enterobacter hormaechei]